MLPARDRTSEVDFRSRYRHLNDRRAHWLVHQSEKKKLELDLIEKETYLHVGSGLPFGGRPHAILRSRQKVQARLGRRGSFTLRLELDDVRVFDLDLDLVSLGAGASSTTGMDGTTFGGILTVVGSGNFRPMEVKGGPLRSKACGLFLGFVSSTLSFGLEKSWIWVEYTGGG